MNFRYERQVPNNVSFSINTKIIWHPKEVETYYDTPRNSHCLFRKDFYVENNVKQAKIHIFADTKYIFYINGIRIGRGPCRSDPRWKYFDTYDIDKYLVKGKNLFSVEVIHYGYGTGHSINRIPALFAECTITEENGETITVSTDKSWKAYLSDSLNKNAPRVNGCKGCIEVWDMRNVTDFTSISFDDSKWINSKERDVKYSPFWNLYPKPIANLEEFVVDSAVMTARGIGECCNNVEIEQMHKQLKSEIDTLETPYFSLPNRDNVFTPVNNTEFNYAVIDFKKVWAGYISLNICGNAGDIVDVIYSEELIDGKPAFNNITYRPFTRFILKDGENNLETKFNYEAFRYVYLFLRNHSGSIVLNNAEIITRIYPLSKESSFYCEDLELTKIWDICTHTLKLCMQDGFLDSPSREQQQWMGDGRFQAIMNYYYSGDCKMHEKLLLQIAQSQDCEGMTCSRYPDANHNLPPIASFCLQWICSFGDYYKFTQKTGVIASLWNSVIAAMRWFSGFEAADGLLFNVPYWQYFDVSKNKKGEQITYPEGSYNSLINLMYAEAMETVVKLSGILEDEDTKNYFEVKLQRLKQGIRSKFWNEEKGAYSDYSIDEPSESISESTNAMALIVLHDKDDKRALKIIKNVFCPQNRNEDIFKVSPYFMVQYYRALNKMNRNDIALSETKLRYSNMLKKGATTTWEDWDLADADPNFPYSACHAWAAAPIVFITENLLGIDIVSGKQKASSIITHLGKYKASIVTPNKIYEI